MREWRQHYTINCPTCGVLVSDCSVRHDAEQRMECNTCKNGHLFSVNIGGIKCVVHEITTEGPYEKT
jgi:hypothetical protein